MSKYKGPPIIDVSTERKVFIGIGVATVIILGGSVWFLTAQDGKEQARLNKPLDGEKVAIVGQQHVKRGESHPEYNSNPPTSGYHWGDGTAGPGEKTEEAPDELVLHSMEHGAAVVWYKPDLPSNQIGQIRNAFNAASGKKIMVPRKSLDVPFALTSWGQLLKPQSINESQITEFINTNQDRAPERAPI